MSDVTRILDRVQQGDSSAADELLPLLYEEVRKLAAAKMAREASGQTLQATALVHEAWLRLGGDDQPAWQNRAHFLAAAAEAMRRILVESARRKLRLKRGGGGERVELHESAIEAPAEDEKILQVHEALEALVIEDPVKAQIVKLRYFVGLSHEEIAAVLGVKRENGAPPVGSGQGAAVPENQGRGVSGSMQKRQAPKSKQQRSSDSQ